MRHKRQRRRWFGRTLSVDPRVRRIAYAYFEDRYLADCRIKNFRQATPVVRIRQFILPFIVQLLDDYAPHALLLPDTRPVGVRRRGEGVSLLIRAIGREAVRRGIAVHFLSGGEVKKAFKAKTRDEIHRAVVERFPEMVLFAPRPRNKPYESERHSTPLFGAIAMYLAWEQQPTLNEKRVSAKC